MAGAVERARASAGPVSTVLVFPVGEWAGPGRELARTELEVGGLTVKLRVRTAAGRAGPGLELVISAPGRAGAALWSEHWLASSRAGVPALRSKLF